MVVLKGQVFQDDFSQSSGAARCFLAGSSSQLWMWHRKLGHLSFDLLSRLSKLKLVRGLPRLRFEKELVCAPCRHAKMVASSHCWGVSENPDGFPKHEHGREKEQ
jgi:hypothetical protein